MGGSPSRTIRPKRSSTKDPCDLVIHTQLKSPIEEIVMSIEPGDILDIVVHPPDQCIALYQGQTAGKIFCLELKELLACIGSGNIYEAKVRSINGIRCAITISRR
ncbi:MAG TPA: hypothetical protein VF691_07355 [Cytophagaceae bacterium]|jgi:hypothetical protein